jgi:hypothetical protein
MNKEISLNTFGKCRANQFFKTKLSIKYLNFKNSSMQINRYQLDVKVQNKTTKYEGSKIRTLLTFILTF